MIRICFQLRISSLEFFFHSPFALDLQNVTIAADQYIGIFPDVIVITNDLRAIY